MSTFYVDRDSLGEDQKTEDHVKHVEFASAEPVRQHEKLCRKDTPHHSKNARTNLGNSKANEERVAAILAQVLEKTEEEEDETTPPPSRTKTVSKSVEGENSPSLPAAIMRVRPKIRLERTPPTLDICAKGRNIFTPPNHPIP